MPGGSRQFVITPTGMVFMDEIDRLSTEDLAKTPDNPLEPAGQGSPQGRGNKKTSSPSTNGNGKSKNAIFELEIENRGIEENQLENEEGFTPEELELLKNDYTVTSTRRKRDRRRK
jgi:hypothetical protein